jgi:hypothetical protein
MDWPIVYLSTTRTKRFIISIGVHKSFYAGKSAFEPKLLRSPQVGVGTSVGGLLVSAQFIRPDFLTVRSTTPLEYASRMRSLSLSVVILSIFVNFGAPTSEAQAIRTLADFQSSSFCRQYHCKEHDRWTLKVGGSAVIYYLNGGGEPDHDGAVELVLNDHGDVTGLDFEISPDSPDTPIDQTQIRAFELFLTSANPRDSSTAISYLHSRQKAWLCPPNGSPLCAAGNATPYTHSGPFELRIGRSYATFGVYLTR